MALELGPQLAVVVDAAVEDDGEAQLGVDHRLVAPAGQVDDGQAAVAEGDGAAEPTGPAPSGPRRAIAAAHAADGLDVGRPAVEAELAADAAHGRLRTHGGDPAPTRMPVRTVNGAVNRSPVTDRRRPDAGGSTGWTGSDAARAAGQRSGPMDAMTLGVEEEFLVVDAETGALVSRARTSCCPAARDVLGEAVAQELNLCQIEVGTPVCTTLDEVAPAPRRACAGACSTRRRRARHAAIAATGHPPVLVVAGTSRSTSTVERYRRMEDALPDRGPPAGHLRLPRARRHRRPPTWPSRS